MKKYLLAILLCCFYFIMIQAQTYPQTLPITHTSFFATGAIGADPILEKGEYPDNNSSATIMQNQWNLTSATTARGGASPQVENSTLSYSNYVDNNAGKAIILADGNLNRRSIYSLTNSNQYTAGVNNVDYYMSLLVRVSGMSASNGYLISWDANHTGTTIRGAVFVRKDGEDGFNFGMSIQNNTSNVSTWSSKLNFNETYLIVMKVRPISSTQGIFTFFVNPTIGNTEAQSTPISSVTTNATNMGLAQIRGITIQQATGISAKLAGLRFSTSWADVVKAAPAGTKLSTPTVGTATSITSSGFTANWTAVDNASSYDVQVYQGATLISTTNFSGQSTATGAITGLSAGTSYTYKVVAKGDGVSYTNSDPSNASAEATTLVPPKLTTPSLGTATSITTSGFTVNWTTVSNASGYDVQVYEGATLRNTTNFSGQATTSGAVDGLFRGTTYTYKVVAKGDNVSYSDSDPSAASSTITTASIFTENFADATVGSGTLEGYNFWALSTNTGQQAGTSPGISGTPLVYSGYPGSNIGRVAVTSTSTTSRATNRFTGIAALQDGTAVYAAFLVKVDEVASSGTKEIFAFNQNDAFFSRGRVAAEHFSGDNTVKYSVSKVSTSNTSDFFNANDTHLLVLKYSKIAGTYNDVVSLFINPDLSLSESEQANRLDITDPGTTSTQSDWGNNPVYIIIRQQGISAKIGGIRVGTTWEEVTGAPININGTASISSYNLDAASKFTVASGATLTIDAATEVNSVTVAPGGKLNINAALTAALSLESDGDATATLMDTYSEPTINATVKQHVTAGRNWYVSPSVAGAAYGVLNRGTSVVEWNETTKQWDTKTSGTLTPGKGYIQVATSNPSVTGSTGTVDFNGLTNSGTIPVTVTRTESGASRGFNLVGNPYPSYLDWSAVIADPLNADILSSFWYRTKNTDDSYIFVTHNGTSGEVVGGTTANTSITKFIPPMQAFWVRVKPHTENITYSSSITFKNSMRDHRDEIGNRFKAPAQSNRMRLRLQVSNGTSNDETLLYFDAQAQNAYDAYDSPKMFNNIAAKPEIFTHAGSERLVINGMNEIPFETEIPLGFVTGVAGDFSISRTEFSNFDSATRVMLKDALNPVGEVELAEGMHYYFSAAPTTASAERFSLVFRAAGTTTNNVGAQSKYSQVYVNAVNQITILAPAKSNFAIYNGLGQLVERGVLGAERETKSIHYSAGVYVVKVNDVTTRVIVK